MKIDTSTSIRVTCGNCKRRTDHFVSMTPEGDVLFLECTRCGAIEDSSKFKRSASQTPRLALMGTALVFVTLAGVGLYIQRQRRPQEESS